MSDAEMWNILSIGQGRDFGEGYSTNDLFTLTRPSYESPSFNPATGEEVPIPPIHTGPAVPTNTTPPAGLFDIAIRDGFRATGGNLELYSTGAVPPRVVEGWGAPDGVKVEGGSQAFTAGATTGYTTSLVCTDFDLAIPDGAVIMGVRVVVVRSQV